MPCHILGPPKSPPTMRTGNWSTHSASRTTWPNTVTTASGFILGSTKTMLAAITIKSTILCSITYRWASFTYPAPLLTVLYPNIPSCLINMKSLKSCLTLSHKQSITPCGGRCWGSHSNSNCLGRWSSFHPSKVTQYNLLQEIISAKVAVKPAVLLTSSLLI